jgi:hypothetical protein
MHMEWRIQDGEGQYIYPVKRWSHPCNKPWRPIGLWDVKAPTVFRQLAHKWGWGCQL